MNVLIKSNYVQDINNKIDKKKYVRSGLESHGKTRVTNNLNKRKNDLLF